MSVSVSNQQAKIREALDRRVADLRQIHPWLTDKYGGSGALGEVVYLTSFRYRHATVRDFAELVVPERTRVRGAHALVFRSTGRVHVDGHVDLDGSCERLDGAPHGPRASAARFSFRSGRLTVSCRFCGCVHMSATETSLEAWILFVNGFGGEIFACASCGNESELRFD